MKSLFQSKGSPGRISSRLLSDQILLIARFGISGLLSTFVYFVVTNVLVLGAKVEPVAASISGYAISLVFSYLMQSRFTFRVTKDTPAQLVRFFATSLFGFAVSYFAMAYFTGVLGLPYFVSAGSVCAILPMANYFIFKRWVFAAHGSPSDAGYADPE